MSSTVEIQVIRPGPDALQLLEAVARAVRIGEVTADSSGTAHVTSLLPYPLARERVKWALGAAGDPHGDVVRLKTDPGSSAAA